MTHIIADAVVAIVCLGFLIGLLWLPKQQLDGPQRGMLVIFGLFLAINAVTNFLTVSSDWRPSKWPEALLAAGGAVLAVFTIAAAFPYVVGLLRSARSFTTAAENRTLRQQLAENETLSQALEQRVIERTRELEELNRRLIERETYFRNLYRSTPVMMYSVDADDRIVDVSDHCLERLGYSAGEMIGNTPERFMLATEPGAPQMSMSISGVADDPRVSFKLYKKKSGEIVEVEQTSVADNDGLGNTLSLVVLKDVTQRNGAFKALNNKSLSLERANESLRQFAYIASHDLQEPLRKIASFTDFLRLSLESGERKDIDYAMDVLSSAAIRARALVTDLLAYSRINNQELDMRTVDLVPLVEMILTEVSDMIAEVDGTITVNVAPLKIEADSVQIRSLLVNLLGNAVKYRSPERRVEIALTGYFDEANGGYLITVADNGIGFDPRFAQSVFEPFRRLHSQTKIQGTGIGLAICRSVVVRHGWTIAATSEPDVGTTFKIRIPAEKLERIEVREKPLVIPAE